MGIKTKRRLASLIMLMLLSLSLAGAEESTRFEKSHDGTAGIEIGIGTDSMIVLENENINLSFEKDGTDELCAVCASEYTLTNSESRKAYAAIAVVRLIKVEAVGVPGSKEDSFISGEKLSVDGKDQNGFIYPIDSPEKLVKKSAYDYLSDTLYHMEFSGYFDEAFARYGVTSTADHEKKLSDGIDGVPRRVEKQMWRLSDTGEEKLCIVVYNLSFDAGESRQIKNTQRIRSSMERPVAISEKGTVFSVSYSGKNLKSFYNVKNVKLVMNMEPEQAESFNSEAPFYSDDGKPTLRFSNGNFNFEFTVGKTLNKDEIYDIYAEKGYVKKLLDIGVAVVSAIVVLSAVFIVYSVRKRKKSGIGLSL